MSCRLQPKEEAMWNFHPEKCQENLHEAPELLISEQRRAAGFIFSKKYISLPGCRRS